MGASCTDLQVEIRDGDGNEFNILFFQRENHLANGVLGERTEKQSNKILKAISLSYFMPKNYNLYHLLGEGN